VAAAAPVSPSPSRAHVGVAGRLAVGAAGYLAIGIAGLRAAEALGVPAVGVIAQVVVDRAPGHLLARKGLMVPVGVTLAGAVGPGTAIARAAIPNVKLVSFAAQASSLVAEKPRLSGERRPLPGRRVRQCGKPAELTRYLLDPEFTG
jgi:hypothetical protein